MSETSQSTGKTARKSPVSPPKTVIEMNPSAHSIGVSKEMLPPRSVASQLKTFTAIGTARASAVTMNTALNAGREAGREHVLAPGDEGERRDHDRGAHHRAVAGDRPARKNTGTISETIPIAGRISA